MSYWRITKFYSDHSCSENERIYYTIVNYKTNQGSSDCNILDYGDSFSVASSSFVDSKFKDALEFFEEYLGRYADDFKGSSDKTYFFDRSYEASEGLIYAYIPGHQQSKSEHQKYYKDQVVLCNSNGDYKTQNLGNNSRSLHTKSHERYCKDVSKKADLVNNNHSHSGQLPLWSYLIMAGGLLSLVIIIVAVMRRRRRSKSVGNKTALPPPATVNMVSLNPVANQANPIQASAPASNAIISDCGNASAPPVYAEKQ